MVECPFDNRATNTSVLKCELWQLQRVVICQDGSRLNCSVARTENMCIYLKCLSSKWICALEEHLKINRKWKGTYFNSMCMRTLTPQILNIHMVCLWFWFTAAFRVPTGFVDLNLRSFQTFLRLFGAEFKAHLTSCLLLRPMSTNWIAPPG